MTFCDIKKSGSLSEKSGRTFLTGYSGARIPVRRCFIGDSPVLFAGCDTAPDIPFRFIFVQHLLDLEVKRLVKGGQTLA